MVILVVIGVDVGLVMFLFFKIEVGGVRKEKWGKKYICEIELWDDIEFCLSVNVVV